MRLPLRGEEHVAEEPEAQALKLHIAAMFFWPKALFMVAWGIAPGIGTVSNGLTEGR